MDSPTHSCQSSGQGDRVHLPQAAGFNRFDRGSKTDDRATGMSFESRHGQIFKAGGSRSVGLDLPV